MYFTGKKAIEWKLKYFRPLAGIKVMYGLMETVGTSLQQ